MGNRLFAISNELGQIARKRLEAKRYGATVEAAYIAREAEIIPEGGWPGGNADTRKAAEKAAKAADLTLQMIEKFKFNNQAELDNLEATRDDLLAERDAWQWTIRDNEIVAVGGFSVFEMHGKIPPMTEEQFNEFGNQTADVLHEFMGLDDQINTGRAEMDHSDPANIDLTEKGPGRG